VNHHVAMAVVDTGYDLLEELAAILLLELAVVDDVVKELAARDVSGSSSIRGHGAEKRRKGEKKESEGGGGKGGRGDVTCEH